jgi:hypothetical protein
MNDMAMSRRALLQASAAAWVLALAPLPVLAGSRKMIPDRYAAWLSRREQEWTIVCASRCKDMGFTPFSTAKAPASKHDFNPLIGLAREMIVENFASTSGLAPPQIAFDGGLVHGVGFRVPVCIWTDFV